jgi:hypothetical protein
VIPPVEYVTLQAFREYAAYDAPRLPECPWSAIQVQHHRWSVAQWGAQQPFMLVLGICEEICSEYLSAQHPADQIDALGEAFDHSMSVNKDRS